MASRRNARPIGGLSPAARRSSRAVPAVHVAGETQTKSLTAWMNRPARGGTVGGTTVLEDLVSPHKQVGRVFSCIRALADACQSFPIRFRQREDESSRDVLDSPIVQLFRRPNPLMRQKQLMNRAATYLSLCGEAPMFLAQRGGRPVLTYGDGPDALIDVPRELWVMRGGYSRMRVEIDRETGLPDEYVYWDSVTGRQRTFPAAAVAPLRYEDPDDEARGLSPLDVAMTASELVHAGIVANAAKVRNHGDVGGWIQLPPGTKREVVDALREMLDEQWDRAREAGKTRILVGGEYHTVQSGTREVLFERLMRLGLSDIDDIYGVPSSMHGDGEVPYATFHGERRRFYELSVLSIAQRVVDEINDFIRRLKDRRLAENHYAYLDLGVLRALREDVLAQGNAARVLVDLGVPLRAALDRVGLGDLEEIPGDDQPLVPAPRVRLDEAGDVGAGAFAPALLGGGDGSGANDPDVPADDASDETSPPSGPSGANGAAARGLNQDLTIRYGFQMPDDVRHAYERHAMRSLARVAQASQEEFDRTERRMRRRAALALQNLEERESAPAQSPIERRAARWRESFVQLVNLGVPPDTAASASTERAVEGETPKDELADWWAQNEAKRENGDQRVARALRRVWRQMRDAQIAHLRALAEADEVTYLALGHAARRAGRCYSDRAPYMGASVVRAAADALAKDRAETARLRAEQPDAPELWVEARSCCGEVVARFSRSVSTARDALCLSQRDLDVALVRSKALTEAQLDSLMVVADEKWREAMAKVLEGPFSSMFLDGINAAAAEAGIAAISVVDPRLLELVKSEAIKLAGDATGALAAEVRSAIAEALAQSPSVGTVRERVREALGDIEGATRDAFDAASKRATVIARSETAFLDNRGRYEQHLAWRAEGLLLTHEWVCAGGIPNDGRTRTAHQAAHGTYVEVGTPWSLTDGLRVALVLHPGDKASADRQLWAWVQCRCGLKPRRLSKDAPAAA